MISRPVSRSKSIARTTRPASKSGAGPSTMLETSPQSGSGIEADLQRVAFARGRMREVTQPAAEDQADVDASVTLA